jgi:hypothetical protein
LPVKYFCHLRNDLLHSPRSSAPKAKKRARPSGADAPHAASLED